MIWYVAVGGALGSASRFLLGTLIQQRFGPTFSIGTLIINITGSLLLGFLRYTTFSTFSYETATLVEDGDHGRALLYVVLSVAGALVGAFAGFALARKVLAFQES